jgi:hypothetical protein
LQSRGGSERSSLQKAEIPRPVENDVIQQFHADNPAGRFVPVQTLNFASGDVDKIASEISRCTLAGVGFEDDG